MSEMEILEPVLDENENPRWLIRENGKFELMYPNTWKCPICKHMVVSEKKPKKCGTCKEKRDFERITRNINPDIWKLPLWEDISTEKLDMKNVYNFIYEQIKRLIVFPEEIQYKLFILWSISTWKVDVWSTVGFPSFLGIPDSGKTRALDVLRQICYRMIHASHVTFPAMVRATHVFGAGVLVDEAQTKLNPRTEGGKEMISFLKTSYRRGSTYTVADKEDPYDLIVYKNFGFKAFAGERGSDYAMATRSITFYMDKSKPEIPDLKYVQNELDIIQTILLNYRYKIDDPPDLGIDFVLDGRMREIFEGIIATGKHIGIDIDDVIQYVKERKEEIESRLQDTIEYEILFAIHEIMNPLIPPSEYGGTDSPERIYYRDIMECMYPDYDGLDVHDIRIKSGQVGYRVRALNLISKKTKSGTCLVMTNKKNRKRLDILYRRYGIEKDGLR